MSTASRGSASVAGDMKSWSSALRTLSIVALLAAPLGCGGTLAFLALERSPLESARDAAPIMGSVQAAQSWNQTTAVATLEVGSEREVASQTSGVVTELNVAAGEPVATGTRVFAVDGAPVIAYVGPYPLYRDIAKGMTGEDVRMAQELLVSTGYLDAADGTAGTATRKAIIAFNADHGHGKDNEVLSAASLLWVPEGATTPKLVKIERGDMLASGAAVWTSTRADDLVRVDAPASDVERSLTIADATVVLPAGETTVSTSSDVAVLKPAFGTNSSTVANLRDAQSIPVGAIPSAAVVTDSSGKMCYFAGTDEAPLALHLSEGSFGMVYVEASQVGLPVLLNPYDVMDSPSCDSTSTT